MCKCPLWRTNCEASGIVIKYRIICLSVIVTGPPFAICLLNNGITEPALPKTLPKRVALYFTNHLTHSLCRTHNICWIHSFISWNHHKSFCMIFLTKFHKILSSKYIIINSFNAVMLHQWHMLMRCCIDNNLWMILIKHTLQRFLMRNRADFNL